MNYEQARFNMVEQQIRTWEVLDQSILDVILRTPREAFVPAEYRALAFADTNIPLGHGQVMMRPNVEGRLLQALGIKDSDIALEIGTGSGYLTACLAQLAKQVYSVDIFVDFVEKARINLAAQGLDNITLSQGDASAGWDDQSEYDVIAITGALPPGAPAYRPSLDITGALPPGAPAYRPSLDITGALPPDATEYDRQGSSEVPVLQERKPARPSLDITGALPVLPDNYKRLLAPNGRLFVILGDETVPVMEAWLITRVGEQHWTTESLFETSIPPLLNAIKPIAFVF